MLPIPIPDDVLELSPEIDALHGLAEIALKLDPDDANASPSDQARALALKALTDAHEHKCECNVAHTRFHEAMAKHNELMAMAERFDRQANEDPTGSTRKNLYAALERISC